MPTTRPSKGIDGKHVTPTVSARSQFGRTTLGIQKSSPANAASRLGIPSAPVLPHHVSSKQFTPCVDALRSAAQSFGLHLEQPGRPIEGPLPHRVRVD